MNTKTNMKLCLLAGLTAATVLTTGCASGPTRVEEDYGNSVRAFQQAQTMNPIEAAAPDTTPVDQTDAQRMENALQAYRENVGDPKNVVKTIEFEIGE